MATISVSLPSDGQTIDAADYNVPINTIVGVINGGLDSNNIAVGGIATTNLAAGIQSSTKEQVPYKFSVYRNAALNSGTAAYAVVTFDTKNFDTGSNVDIVTNKGRFTAPIAGFYQFNAVLTTAAGSGANHTLSVALYKNGSLLLAGGTGFTLNGVTGSVVADIVSLAANDYVEVYAYGDVALALSVGAATANRFSGFLVSAT